MRNCILAPIELPFRLLDHDLRIDFIYGLALCLFFPMENGQIYFCVSGYSSQRFGTLVVRRLEHAVELSQSTFFAR